MESNLVEGVSMKARVRKRRIDQLSVRTNFGMIFMGRDHMWITFGSLVSLEPFWRDICKKRPILPIRIKLWAFNSFLPSSFLIHESTMFFPPWSKFSWNVVYAKLVCSLCDDLSLMLIVDYFPSFHDFMIFVCFKFLY